MTHLDLYPRSSAIEPALRCLFGGWGAGGFPEPVLKVVLPRICVSSRRAEDIT